MARIILLALALLTGIWATDLIDGGNGLDPNGVSAYSDGHAVLDPDGGATAGSDGGNVLDPDG